MTPDEYLEWITPAAQAVCTEHNLPWQVCVAQGALESEWGRYGLGNGGFNIFGRKWGYWGDYVEVETQEVIHGEWVTIMDKFQSYSSLEEAIKDWCVLMTEEPVYMPATEYYHATGDIWGFVERMAVHYATDPDYCEKICRTIRACELVQR